MPSAQVEPANPEQPPGGVPAAPPRELTGAIRRKAWGERRVRLWWMLGAGLLIVTCYYGISRIYAWTEEKRLITQGVKVVGEVVGWSGGLATKAQHFKLAANTVVNIEYTYNGHLYEDSSELMGRTEQIETRTPLPLFIDPKRPQHWTARTVPASIWTEALAALMLFPFVILLFVFALLSRQRVLRIYREGEAVVGEVMSVGHSATAPLSRMISCAAHVGGDDRVIKILLPPQKAPAVGETLWLLALPNRPEQAVPVDLFE
jgi:hypothetical protein